MRKTQQPRESRINMPRVLCTGAEPALMRTRQLLLENAGHTVVAAMDEESLIAACEQNAFEVVLIGQMLSVPSKMRILVLVRQHCPSARVLELYTRTTGRILKDADSWLEVPVDVPRELAEHVSS